MCVCVFMYTLIGRYIPDVYETTNRARNYDFFQGAQLHLHKLHKGVVYSKQYIFGLPAEI